MTTTEKKAKYPTQITRNFALYEIVCSCCGFHIIDPRFLRKMQALRNRIGKAINVNSWCRCWKHNIAVGGAGDSYHLYGMAADIKVAGMTPATLAAHAKAIGLHTITYSWGVHVDIRNG